MTEKTTKGNKERTLTLKPGVSSTTNLKAQDLHLEFQQLLLNQEEERYLKPENP